MIIKLQPDQVGLFWDMYREGMIESNAIPREFQQEYAVSRLIMLMSGKIQAWMYWKVEEGEKKIIFVCTTRILDEKFYGVRVLNIESIYGVREIEMDSIEELYAGLEEFAKSQKCNVIAADYSIPRVKEFLMHTGFEKHRTICRKFI